MDKCTFLRTALRQKRPALGTWLTMPGTAVARTIASVPGLQWILIDAEHGQITDRDYYEVRCLPFRSILALEMDAGLPRLPVPRTSSTMRSFRMESRQLFAFLSQTDGSSSALSTLALMGSWFR